MGIFSKLFKKFKPLNAEEREAKFNELSVLEKERVVDKLLDKKDDEAFLAETIAKEPYMLAHIIGRLKDKNCLPLIEIATINGANVYDLIDKNDKLSNATIVNIACVNQPELILELDDMPSLQDMITTETVIKAFVKNPEIIFSSCKALDSKIRVEGTKRDGTKVVRQTKLINQLKRAMNLYFRPKKEVNDFDKFAQKIAEQIDSRAFIERVEGNKMTTRLTTAANETLKRDPEKGKVIPAKALHKWNNRVMYTIPNQAKKSIKKSKVDYEAYRQHLLGLLSNSSINSFSDGEKTKLVKRCVSIIPEIYFNLPVIEEVDYSVVARQLTIQLSAYEAFKAMHDKSGEKMLFELLSETERKNVLAKSKANSTRKANKLAKRTEKEMTLVKER